MSSPYHPASPKLLSALAFYLILELRKEKSRDAARSRRGKENYEFYELAKLLPLPAAITSQLDKASIIRLSISYLKLREFSNHGDPPWNRDALPNNKTLKGHGRRRNLTSVDLIESHQGTHILQSLDGFAFALGSDGRFLYISETVSIYLGLSQVEMTGSSIFDYVHHADHNELAEYLGLGFQNVVSNAPSPGSTSDEGSAPSTPRPMSPSNPDRVAYMIPNPDKPLERTFCLRMKSTLTKRGVHVRTSGYRVVYVTSNFRPQMCFNLNRKSTTQYLGLVGIAIALPPPTITELRIESDTFIMRLSPNLKIIYCDTMITELTDWNSDDVNNRMFYDFCHAGDVIRILKHHEDLMRKGQVLTDYFRFMNKNGGYVWVQMCATTLFSSKTSDDHTILAIIYVLSGILHRGCVMDQNQTSGPIRHLDTDQSEHQSEHGSDIGEAKSDTLTCHKSPTHDPWDTSVTSSTSQPVENLQNSPDELDNIDLDKGQTEHCLTPDDLIDCQEEAARIISDNLHDKISVNKTDFKYSRRKTEKPRKRKRDYSVDQDDVDGHCTISLINSHLSHEDKSERCSSTSNVSNHNEDYEMSENSDNTLYSVTEDLSRRSSNTHIREENQSELGWQNLDDINHNSVASSVKDLEDVMNRHLPVTGIDNGMKSPTDLTVQQIGGAMNRQRSAIQWAGNSHDSSTLPASNLLRTLYANRESVIRSNTRPSYVNNDPVNLLTPPENEGHKDHLTLHIPHIVISKSTALPSYSGSTVSCSLQDTFDITPPASVSPNDKIPSHLYDGHYEHSVASSSLAAPIPVKSQAFSLSFVSPSPDYNNGTKIHPASYQVGEHPPFIYGGNSSSGVIYDSWY
ncbi:NPAS1_3 [Mytilus coruscus]|uniref:NPAS1_3 n=1 Tax=Mytilus coruscus TaxID=42192 RepID=A0A6J8CMC9_MYTCO|nr:NPAS1_3 [Mytilus coruscus]